MDPLAGSAWSAPGTVAGFSQSPPNDALLQFADGELRLLRQTSRGQRTRPRALDIGCGAARNAVPLAELGWDVLGLDLSWPMVSAAGQRAAEAGMSDRLGLALAPMDAIPVRDRSIDLVIAHGIWNLARSGSEFRRAVHEAARVATAGAALFVFTFSRHTLPEEAEAVADETFVFTQFSGQPQCFLTEAQLMSELARAGFDPDPALPVRELNRPRPGALPGGTGPVIYEGAFRRR
jgi:ubiquinone/menaquinone biosynthesis C-methylase UbiE